MPLDILLAVPFTSDMLAAISDFDYGDEPYQQELAQWMLNDSIHALMRETKVWLYLNQVGEFVGYGSLGVTRWHYPDPSSAKTTLVIVPAVALRKQFWGKPDGPQEDRYSSQMMRHLLNEADGWPGQPPAVGRSSIPTTTPRPSCTSGLAFNRFSILTRTGTPEWSTAVSFGPLFAAEKTTARTRAGRQLGESPITGSAA
jgi:hypothetical protein